MSDLDVVTDVYAARNRARFRSSPAPGVPSSRSCSLAGRLKASDFG